MSFLPTSSRVKLLAFSLALVLFFVWVNKSSYRRFFTDDDLDNLANARGMTSKEIGKALILPKIGGEDNFRAVGYFYYFAMVRAAGLHYISYVVRIQALHLIH